MELEWLLEGYNKGVKTFVFGLLTGVSFSAVAAVLYVLSGLAGATYNFASSNQTGAPRLSHEGGVHKGLLNSVVVSPSHGDDFVTYTLDGTTPSIDSARYVTPFDFDKTTVLKVRAFNKKGSPSEVVTRTYFIQETTTLPIVSLSVDPKLLFDETTGIYMRGPDGNEAPPHKGANFHKDVEIPVVCEFYGETGLLDFVEPLGLKIHGGFSRANPMKSLLLTAREKYGRKKIHASLFDEIDIDKYDSLILRNSGNDCSVTHFRDALCQSLGKRLNIERQFCRPVTVFINGRYWGVHNMRNRIDKKYLKNFHDGKKDDVDIIKYRAEPVQGSSAEEYEELLECFESFQEIDAEVYRVISGKMDIDNFIDYHCLEIYCGNMDWPGKNFKIWKSREGGSKWRWIPYDLDQTFGLFDDNVYFNSLEYALATDGPWEKQKHWTNPPWATYLLRRLVEHDGFRRRFLSRFRELLDGDFSPENVLNEIDMKKTRLLPEIERHCLRWGVDVKNWHDNVENLEKFARARSAIVKRQIKMRFQEMN